jgi:hypothetical protein
MMSLLTTKPARRGYRLVPCTGEAHGNPFIDNCGQCAPRWGWVEVPCQALRVCKFSPYRKGHGPTFELTLWDTGKPYGDGPQWGVGYRLVMREGGRTTVLFCAEDYGCSPLHAIDSDSCVEGIMGFLTLRPGDTDEDFFKNYTWRQRNYCDQHAEALSCEVQTRFCDENGRVRRAG